MRCAIDLFQIAVRRRDGRTFTSIVCVPPTRSNSFSCKTRNSFTCTLSDVADLVEKQRSAVRQFEPADLRATAPLKAPFS